MLLTEKFGEALLLAINAAGHRLTRCGKGFRAPGQFGQPPVVTRRTANALVNAGLADFDDRMVPSVVTLTSKGVEAARAHEAATTRAAA